MEGDLSSLISQLSIYQPIGEKPRPKALEFIRNYQQFISTLIKINQMVGLESAKKKVTDQVKFFIVNYRRYGRPTNKEKLHTLLYGPPGCGKTKLGKYLAQLWMVSGCLPEPTQPPPQSNPHNKAQLTDGPKLIDPALLNLTHDLEIRKSQVQKCQEKIKQYETSSREILTLFNNVRKKVKARNPEQEGHIQAKFQEVKRRIREVSGQGLHPPIQKRVEILPVAIPITPGTRGIFNQNIPPTLPSIPSPTMEKKDVKEPKNISVKVGHFVRGDLIGKYQGHTTDRMRTIFKEYDGGVIFLDEVYNLCTGDGDDFGREILTEIIHYMTEYPDRIIFIFGGYREDIEKNILNTQVGLARRFNWTIEIDEYTNKEICQIFQQQLSKYSWKVKDEDSDSLENFFEKNIQKFPHCGGDTERLCVYVKEIFYEKFWNKALDDQMADSDYSELFGEIDMDIIQEAYKKYLENSVKHLSEVSEEKDFEKFQSQCHMYV